MGSPSTRGATTSPTQKGPPGAPEPALLPPPVLVFLGGLLGPRPVLVEAGRGHLRLERLHGLLLLGDALLQLRQAGLHALDLAFPGLAVGRRSRFAQAGGERIVGARARGGVRCAPP